jgi:hypothetical protein
MKRRTRHTLLLIGIPILLALALGGWIADALRKPFTLLGRVTALDASSRPVRPLHRSATKLRTSP